MALRGSAMQATAAVNTITVSLPAGSAAGDLAVLFSGTAYPVNVPSGWTTLYQNNALNWNFFAAYKTLSSGDIATGSVTISNATPYMPYSFDMHAALAVFVGAGGGVREYEVSNGSSVPLTNTTSGAVLNTDTGVYWATARYSTGPAIPTITPGSGSATSLQSAGTTNAYSLLADQAMPGGALSVVSSWGNSFGVFASAAAQVVVEVPLVSNTARSTTFLFA